MFWVWVIQVLFVLFIWLGVCIVSGVIEEYIINSTPHFSEDCYYCKYSKHPHSLRDKNKNTCNIINNKDWSSEQVRDCKYRVIE